MYLTLLIISAILLIVIPIVVAFGKVIGAGGNAADLLPHHKEAKSNQANNVSSQILRAIAGLLFSAIMLSPVAFVTVRGRPLLNVNHGILFKWIFAIIVLELILLIIIKIKDLN